MGENYSVRGSVSYPDGTPALGVTAMALDTDSGADDLLGADEFTVADLLQFAFDGDLDPL